MGKPICRSPHVSVLNNTAIHPANHSNKSLWSSHVAPLIDSPGYKTNN